MSRLTPRQIAARKANETRAARKYFRECYPRTARIAEYVLRHPEASRYEVAGACNVWDFDTVSAVKANLDTVSAVKANLNRFGVYSALARACNFA